MTMDELPDHTHHLTFGCIDFYREYWLMTSTVSWKVASANATVISIHPHIAKTSSKLNFPLIRVNATQKVNWLQRDDKHGLKRWMNFRWGEQ